VTAAAPRPAFAHASEAELARILDFYEVRWVYEPDTFPIGWSMSGDVVESFSPDFYLPDLDLYVELTTLKQKLVRKKNRKLRRLRELYPDVRIKLFYARDFRMLLLKFGRLALLDDLSGSTGQATPPRPADRIVAEAGAAAAPGRPVTGALPGPSAATHPPAGGGARRRSDPPAPLAPSSSRGRRRGRRRRAGGDPSPVADLLPDAGSAPA
jgi:hypoxanthine phosphoribosyltransferase